MPNPDPPIRILLLEDDPADAALTLATLDRNGIPHSVQRVDNQPEFVAALQRNQYDLILSDCSLPAFDGRTALRLAREHFQARARAAAIPEVPFIFVSGTIGEEVAIETLKSGATDYVLKQRLSRLAPAVRRALTEAREREERRTAERSSREMASLFRSLFDQVALGVAIASLDGALVRVNPGLAAILERRQEELVGLTLDQLAEADDAGLGAREHGELLQGQRASYELERRYLSRGGAARRTRAVVSLIRGEQGAPSHVIHLIEDVTERRQMQQHFLEAQKMEAVGRLSAGFAHDFNNLLTVINGYTEVLLKRVPPEASEVRPLEAIQRAGLRASTLTRRLLALARQQEVQLHPCDLNALLTGLEPVLRHLVGAGIAIAFHLDPAAGFIHADETQLEQIVMNLVINARDALVQGGEIVLSTRPGPAAGATGEPTVCFTVADNGTGMDAATQARIFEPFFTTKEVGKGTGLGLWMVREIVEQSHGSIHVDSTPGQGTRFTICLPRVDPPSPD